jgi:hypothetical protein
VSKKYSKDILKAIFGSDKAESLIKDVDESKSKLIAQLKALQERNLKEKVLNKFLDAILIIGNDINLDRNKYSTEELLEDFVSIPLSLFGYDFNNSEIKDKAESDASNFIERVIAYAIINTSNNPRHISAIINASFIDKYISAKHEEQNKFFKILRGYTKSMMLDTENNNFKNIINLDTFVKEKKGIVAKKIEVKIGNKIRNFTP